MLLFFLSFMWRSTQTTTISSSKRLVCEGGGSDLKMSRWVVDFFSNWFKPHISYVTFIFKAGPRLSRWKINWSITTCTQVCWGSRGLWQGWGLCWCPLLTQTGQIQCELTPSAFGNRLSEAPLSDWKKGQPCWAARPKNYITFVLLCSHIFHHLLHVVSSDPSTEKTFWPKC